MQAMPESSFANERARIAPWTNSHPYGRRQPFTGNIGKNQHGLPGICPEHVEEVPANLVGRHAEHPSSGPPQEH
jgi:hypothetical protein